MRRLGAVLVLLVLVVAGLMLSGVLRVRIDVSPPATTRAEGAFWREVSSNGQLPPAFQLWIDLAARVQPAVTNVSTTERVQSPLGPEGLFHRFFADPHAAVPRTSLGSGFIATSDGFIVTNFHVVKNASEIRVRLANHSEHRARVVGGDAKTDIALLKIEARDLPVLAFGDSDSLRIGAPVMAVGNPFGLEQTVTTGIVSAKERFIGTGPYDDFVQTDAAINPGNSGGPLIDAQGSVIGINTAIFSESGGSVGIGFATPINLAKQVLPQLRETGKVVRGFLGVVVGPVTTEGQEAERAGARNGAQVMELTRGGPASRAGLEPGDVITRFQEHQIRDPRDLTRRVAGTPPGTTVSLQIVRQGQQRTVEVKLDELKETRGDRRG